MIRRNATYRVIFLLNLVLSICSLQAIYAQQYINIDQVQSVLQSSNPVFAPVQTFVQESFSLDSTYIFINERVSDQPEWKINARLIYEYDLTYSKTTVYKSSIEGSSWTEVSRERLQYRPDGMVLESLLQVYDRSSNKYKHSQLESYDYNYLGYLSSVLTSSWEVDAWIPRTQVSHRYNDNFNLSEKINFTWIDSSGVWEPMVKVSFAYSPDENLTEETSHIWNADRLEWEANNQIWFIYDENNELIEEVSSLWSVEYQNFVPSVVTQLEFNALGQLELVSPSFLGEGGGNEIQAAAATYTNDGNLAELVVKGWDSDAQQWLPVTREENYWSSSLSGGESARSRDIVCRFVNPYTTGLPWFCENLKSSVIYSVKIFDMMGRLFHSHHFEGGSPFRIHTPLKPGFYMVVIEGGLDLHTEKILVR